jgi:hypothetical protein
MALLYSGRRMMMMLKRTPIILFSTLMVAMVMLFAADQARAFSPPDGQCTDQEKKNFECFKSAGYLVEIVPDDQGNFPQIVNGNSKFTYRITNINATRKIILVDALIRNDCTPELKILTSYPTGKLFTDGKGGPITNFGQWLTLDDTWWWNYYGWPPPGGVQISLTIAGNNVGVDHNAMLVGTASIFPNEFGKGDITLPGCKPLGVLPAAQCINLFESETEKLSMSVRRANDSCIIEKEVAFYRSSNCTGNPEYPIFEDPDSTFVYKSGTFGGCPELVEVTKTSPACVTLTLQSGRKTKVCY